MPSLILDVSICSSEEQRKRSHNKTAGGFSRLSLHQITIMTQCEYFLFRMQQSTVKKAGQECVKFKIVSFPPKTLNKILPPPPSSIHVTGSCESFCVVKFVSMSANQLISHPNSTFSYSRFFYKICKGLENDSILFYFKRHKFAHSLVSL